MTLSDRGIMCLWLLSLACSGWLVAHTRVTTDLAALLPASADRVQRLLVSQLRDGVASRLMLIGLEGAEPEALAEVSRKMTRRLLDSGLFNYANNGEAAYLSAEREVLMQHRYLLSPSVAPGRFTPAALRDALERDLQLLGSPMGSMIKSILPSDPTGELIQIMDHLSFGGGPTTLHGVWFSADGKRAQLIAETRAAGFDIDRQQEAVEVVRRAAAVSGLPDTGRLVMSGPGVFAVESRSVIERDSWKLSVIASVLVILILLGTYRSLTIVLASMLPVLSGLLVGVAAVGALFGSVHGITLGFGATLIGEAVDYPTYLFTHAAPGEPLRETLKRIGPTLRLAVLTTVFGGLSMLLSSFTGLSQLGVLTVTGVLVAGMVTRWVLPALLPHPFTGTEQRRLPMNWTASVRRPAWGAKAVWVVMAAAVIGLLLNPTSLWDDDLAHLSPISESAKALDKQLRSELGAPDVRHLLVISGESREAVLVRSEAVAGLLRGLVNRNVLTGFDMASLYLPAQGTQLARRTALPDAARLQASLNQAVQGLPFREGLFVPFLRDIERAREGKLLEAEDLQGSALSMKIRGLLFQDGSEWIALAPLRGVEDEKELAAGIRDWGNPFVVLLDLKEESNRLIAGYRQQSLWLTGIGLLAIALVLWWGLRDVRQVGRVLTPVVIAVVLVVALLLAFGEQLTLFHLVSLLLVIGIGLNYALFFNRAIADEADGQRTMLSLTVCSLCTLSAFGVLAWSQTPVLHAIGMTVGIGCVCSLMTSALLARSPHQAFAA